jgi:hypothetical protein
MLVFDLYNTLPRLASSLVRPLYIDMSDWVQRKSASSPDPSYKGRISGIHLSVTWDATCDRSI